MNIFAQQHQSHLPLDHADGAVNVFNLFFYLSQNCIRVIVF